ncbi:FapA family protein [Bacillus sp. FJAT-29790]|uniref:DUF342 domain-containing protein n=1 Tax=Bacillus sp. FJAT-29790 TaxID=1895002 RepID=UPI001C20FED5|nr:FapA family protein [Bacillus sp. FJAT-29790]
MEKYYRITIAQNRLSAKIELIENEEKDFSISSDELNDFLTKKNVTFGLKSDLLRDLCDNPMSISYPATIAEGILPRDGVDGYLLNEVKNDKNQTREKFNFRNVMEIPSVKSGQILASIIPPTPGTPGTDVSGRIVPAKNGKPVHIRPGKNVILNGTHYYSVSDGQLSLTNKMISVNPVFEVKGDLDLKTGNIDFIGNVIISGNVPSGYEIKAGGDIKIGGLIEGAFIHADGNILISGGVTGGNKGRVTAGGTIQAAYLNQANVQAGQDILIGTSILHSNVQAGGSIHCRQALVIGGVLISSRDLHIKEVGNHLFTKTELRAGFDPALTEREQELNAEKAILSENDQKITSIEQKLLQIGKLKGQLTENQKSMILKQRTTKNLIQKQLNEINTKIEELEEERCLQKVSSIYIYDTIYPNSTLIFGKYAKLLQKKHVNVKFFFSHGEIASEPIV